MMTAFRALVRKDLQIFFGDRRAVIMSFVAPIAIGAFFGYIFGGQGGQTQQSKIPVLLADLDGSTISRDIFTRLQGEKSLDVRASGVEEARAAVRKGSATAAVVIPKDFGDMAGNAFFSTAAKPEITVLYDPSHSAEQGMVQGILTGTVMQSVSKEMFTGKSGQKKLETTMDEVDKSTQVAAGDKKMLRDLFQSVRNWNQRAATDASVAANAPGMTIPYQLKEEAVTARTGVQYNGYAHSFGGMGVQFIMFMGINMGIEVLLARERGLWKRLRAAPLSRAMLLGSRAVSGTLIGMIILFVIFGFARVVFGVRIEGSMAGFALVCLAFSLWTATFGLMIAALGKTVEATRGLSILAVLLMSMLGGAWVPTFVFPAWLQKLTVAVPTRWAVDGLDSTVWRGLGFSEALMPVAVLLFCAALFGAITVAQFRWEAEG